MERRQLPPGPARGGNSRSFHWPRDRESIIYPRRLHNGYMKYVYCIYVYYTRAGGLYIHANVEAVNKLEKPLEKKLLTKHQ